MTQPGGCTAYPFMTDDLVVDTPAAAMCQELAVWQATGPVATSLDFDDVLAAAQPLLQGRFAWSVNFTGDGSSDYPVAQHIALLHISGASLSTVVVDYPKGLGAALAGLIGLRLQAAPAAVTLTLTTAPDAAAGEMLDRLIEQADAAKAGKPKAKPKTDATPEPQPTEVLEAPEAELTPELDEFADESGDGDELLADTDKQTCLAMLKALPADARRKFTIAFRSHFEVDENVKAVGGCITQRKHQLFVQDFIDEVELQGGA